MDEASIPLPDSVQVAVVGAGVAGLTVARALIRAGRKVHVFEASEEIGGRMRTVLHPEGFRLDVGFHVLLTGYPAVREELDVPRLDVRPFEPGCVVSRGGKLHPLADPSRGGSLREALRFPIGAIGDKLKLRSLAARAPERQPDRTTMEHLRSLGFSDEFVEGLLAPFFGGVLLDRSLAASSRYFASIVRAFAAGPAGIPAAGIGAVPKQIAEGIPAGAIHLGCAVESLSIEGGRVRGLTIAGREIRAEAVILACGLPGAARLSGLTLPDLTPLGATVVYFTAPRPPTDEKRLFVRGDRDGWTNHFAVLTNVAPSLAPAGHHLLMGTILGVPEMNEGAISEKIRTEMAWWFPHGLTHSWRWLRTFKIPNASWALPPGFAERLPRERTAIGGLFLAGDVTREPSLQGALASAHAAAEAVLKG